MLAALPLSAKAGPEESLEYAYTVLAKKVARLEGAAPYCPGVEGLIYEIDITFKDVKDEWEMAKMEYIGAKLREAEIHQRADCDSLRIVDLGTEAADAFTKAMELYEDTE